MTRRPTVIALAILGLALLVGLAWTMLDTWECGDDDVNACYSPTARTVPPSLQATTTT